VAVSTDKIKSAEIAAVSTGGRSLPERQIQQQDCRYLIAVPTEVNVVVSWLPRPLTAEMIIMPTPAAIRQYSIAVTPD
jgi:hypothetical protein